MALDGRFGSTDCLGVEDPKTGKTVWIFKPEDLQEVVPEDVYKAFEAFLQEVQAEDTVEALQMELDGYSEDLKDYQSCWDNVGKQLVDLINEIKKMDRLDRGKIISKLNKAKEDLINVREG